MASNSQPLLLSGGGLAFNEIKSITGILKIAQVVCGIVCYSLFFGDDPEFSGFLMLAVKKGVNCLGISECKKELALSKAVFVLMQSSFCFWIVTFLILATCLSSSQSASLLKRTIFGHIYHTVAALLYVGSGLAVVISVLVLSWTKQCPYTFSSGFFGVASGIFHAVHAYRSFKEWRAQ